MVNCVSVHNMRLSDRNTIESGIDSLELIRRAAEAVFHSVEWKGVIAVITGNGNNGADGYALSLLLQEHGYNVTVISVSDKLHNDCDCYASICKSNGIAIKKADDFGCFDFDIIVDCLLGTGFNGGLRTNYLNAIRKINESNAFVVSVDINSGMNGDTGDGECVVKSDLTIAIEFLKNGQIADCAKQYINKLICVPIGIQLAYVENIVIDESELMSMSKDEIQELHDSRYSIIKCPFWVKV